MINILKLNEIDKAVNNILKEGYNISKDIENPDAIILRSYNMHNFNFGDNLLAVARAGAGTNNIPVDKLTELNIPVFNAPGANANAVKELIFCAMLASSRNWIDAVLWANHIDPNAADFASIVETGKKQFVGPELKNKTLGVIGLGAIGRMVANEAISFGMKVLGYDPYLSIDGAWSLSSSIVHATDIKKVFKESDFVTLHVPLNDSTRNIINAEAIGNMKSNCTVLNFARGELVDNAAIVDAVINRKIKYYITDFPDKSFIGVKNIFSTPHLGASTPEAETQCAIMAANELKEYIENGNIANSINYPCVSIPRKGNSRVTILHKNIANMLTKATSFFSKRKINIENIVSSSRNDVAYMIIDINGDLPEDTLDELSKVKGFLKIRVFNN